MDLASAVTIIAASSASGKKIFLPGFLFSLCVQFKLVHLASEVAFLGSPWAAVLLGALAALEILAEFFPGVNSTMKSAKIFVAPAASMLMAWCMLGDTNTGLKVAMILVCAACGEAVQLASAGVSLASVQIVGGGGGDPLVNIEETLSSSILVFFSVFLPILSAALIVLVLAGGVIGFLLYRRNKRKRAEKRKARGVALLQEQKQLRSEIRALMNGESADVLPQEVEEQLRLLNQKLEVNKQALFDFEAQGYFPVPPQYRKDGFLYAKSKRYQLVVLLLSVLPGLGHIYAGQWQKGLIILGVSICIDFVLTPILFTALLPTVVLLPAAFIAPAVFRCIVFTDLEMIRRKLNGSIPVRPFEFLVSCKMNCPK